MNVACAITEGESNDKGEWHEHHVEAVINTLERCVFVCVGVGRGDKR